MKRLLLNLCIAAAILLLVEGACWLDESPPKYRLSELTGYELVPGVDLGNETVNGAGLRGREVRPRADVSLRILCMGGSTTWGHKVDDDETWPAYLEQVLAESGWAGVEVLNGGVSGWGLEQIVLSLEERRLAELQPDLVLVYSGWNVASLKRNPALARHVREGAEAPKRTPLHHSAFVRWLDDKLDLGRAPGVAAAAGDRDARRGTILPEDRDARRAKIQAVMEEVFPGYCQRLAALGRLYDVPVVMIRYPGLMQVPPEAGGGPDARYVERLERGMPEAYPFDQMLEGGVRQWESGVAVVSAAAAGAGLPVLDVAGDMLSGVAQLRPEEKREEWISYFRDRMHMEPEGHVALARSVARLLADADLLPKAPR